MDPRLVELRAAFPVLERGLCFLDWAATGLISEPTRLALHRYADELAECAGSESTWVHAAYHEVRNEARSLIAAHLGGDPKDVALVESTTFGLNAACGALRLQAGSNVILGESDYLAVAMPWRQRQKRDGLELRFVPSRGGVMEALDLLDRVDEKTRVIAISTIAWTTGALVDIEALAREARMRGILIVLDAIQTFGVVPLDVRKTPVAFVACGGHKWLGSPMGSGFLWVHPEVAARHQPAFTGFLGGRAPRGTWFQWFSDPLARIDEEVLFPATARSFEVGGTPSYPGAIGLREAMTLLRRIPGELILQHVRDLGTRLIDGLDRLGLEVRTPREPERRAGVVVFGWPGGADAERALVADLQTHRIAVSVRYGGGVGGVRVSVHAMSRVGEIDRLLSLLETHRVR